MAAAQLFARRWPLYLGACAAVFGLQTLFVEFVHVQFAAAYASLVGAPLINAVVMLNAGADAAGALPTARARVERFLERTWAVIVLDAGISLAGQIGFESMAQSDAFAMLQGFVVMLLAAMLVYAEPFACLEGETQTLTLVPFALMRSMMLAWVNMSRIFSLFAIEIAVTILGLLVMRAANALGPHAGDLLGMAYETLSAAPLAALFAVAYLDTVAQERAALK